MGRAPDEVTERDGLEVHEWSADPAAVDEAPLVLLHEGLGSAGLWRGFPGRLAAATGRRVLAVSRRGHGRSRPLPRQHGTDYMHREATLLRDLLADTLALHAAVLVGHSDGASIALLHAADPGATAIEGLVLLAPHVVVEDETVEGIEDARRAYLETDLAERMARHHDDADALFWAWNDVWLSSAFRRWDIREVLPRVHARTLMVQCADDEYGTLAQLDLIAAAITAPYRRVVLPSGGHSPHLADPDGVTREVATFLGSVPARVAD